MFFPQFHLKPRVPVQDKRAVRKLQLQIWHLQKWRLHVCLFLSCILWIISKVCLEARYRIPWLCIDNPTLWCKHRLVTTLAYFKAHESEQIMHSWARTGRMRRKMRICYQDVFQGDWEEINLVPRELTKWTHRKHQANRKLAKIPFPGHY